MEESAQQRATQSAGKKEAETVCPLLTCDFSHKMEQIIISVGVEEQETGSGAAVSFRLCFFKQLSTPLAFDRHLIPY